MLTTSFSSQLRFSPQRPPSISQNVTYVGFFAQGFICEEVDVKVSITASLEGLAHGKVGPPRAGGCLLA